MALAALKLVKLCPICKGAEYLERRDVPVAHPEFSRLFPCACVRDKLESRRLAKVRINTGLPPNMQNMRFENFVPEQAAKIRAPHKSETTYEASRIRVRIQQLKRRKISLPEHVQIAKAQALEFARKPQGFLTLIGEPGCGKTHLAVAIVQYRLARSEAIAFAVVPDLLDHLRATFGPRAAVSYDERFEAYKSVCLLILDDLGTQKATPWADEKLYQLVNHRYNHHLPMVVTSNDLPTDMDLRLQSRLFDQRRNCVFEILAGDYRMRRPR